MNDIIPVAIKNREVIESLLYSLRIKFSAAVFTWDETRNAVLLECGDAGQAGLIRTYISDFLRGISGMADRITQKSLLRHEGRRQLNGALADDFLNPTALPGVCLGVADMADTMAALDRIFSRFAERYAAVPVEIPALISSEELEKAGYLPKDVHQVGRVGTFDSADHCACLSPAGCLPLYPMLGRSEKPLPPAAYTALCRVFRYEGGKFDGPRRFSRLWEFRVREIIFLADAADREARKKDFIDFMAWLLKRLDIGFEISTATDIFFNPEYARQTLYQLLGETKIECRVTLNGRPLSIGSFNIHTDHFVSQFSIKTVPQKLETFCMGFGMERFSGALLLAYPDRSERAGVLSEILSALDQGGSILP